MRESLRCHASRELEARRPVTFGGLGDGADGPASRATMRVAATELERPRLRGLLAGALWTAARFRGHRIRDYSACPHCGAAHEDEVHILWDRPEWEAARTEWRPWLLDALEGLPQLGPPPHPPPCLRRAGLMPPRLSQGVERARMDEFVYHMYGMYLAVTAARMAAGQGNPEGPWLALFPEAHAPARGSPSRGGTWWAHCLERRSRSARNHAQGCLRAGGGPRTSCRTSSDGPGPSARP